MKLLLDTQVWLWAAGAEQRRLSPRVRRSVEATSSELFLSPISVWEAYLLALDGRLRTVHEPTRWLREMMRDFPTREAALTSEVAIESQRLDLPHQDPADRFIAATALVYGLTLVTADERLSKCPQLRVLYNG